ncbi:MAG: DUF2169 domain-containing protein [Polyangiaceae bacterium]|nr:DUF2169 domain-containing protein [Polyangiaceae bacterium]
MEIVTQSLLRAAQLTWRPSHGGVVLTVVCKATFSLRPGTSPLATSQVPVAPNDVYAESGSLQVASDLVPLKKQPEVLLMGHAYAPGGKRATSFSAHLTVGDIHKSIQVTGDRTFGLDGQLSDPSPITKMPLNWERAAGGPDTVNPVGLAIGGGAKPDMYGRIRVPNLLPVDLNLTSRTDLIRPIGFGPLAPHWPTRAACLQRHVAGWDPVRWNERSLPPDIDLGYFSAASPDQRRGTPFGDDLISLENLHPLFGQLSTRLTAVTPIVQVERGRGTENVQLRGDTLIIDTDKGTAMLLWRGHVVLDHADEPGRILVTQGELAASTPPTRPSAPPVFDHTQAPDLSGSAASPLPFGNSNATVANPASQPSNADSANNAVLSGATMAIDDLYGGTMAFGFANPTPAVPFSKSNDESPARPAPAVEGVGLPFQPSVSPSADLPVSNLPPPPAFAPIQPTYLRRAPSETPAPLALPPSTGEAIAPPPLLLAVSENPSPPAEPSTAPTPNAYPPRRCGGIHARIQCDEENTSAILEAENLSADQWEEVHSHWEDRMLAEASRGNAALLSEYDQAYVETLEAERLPITQAVYTSLAEANSCGELDEKLAELKLPEDAWVHIQRVQIARTLS